ncbi:MAG: hypothetical protein LLG04_07630 [Parachlamydia sp.]|nr:hypothetical protein [Parachlamydia sp.]
MKKSNAMFPKFVVLLLFLCGCCHYSDDCPCPSTNSSEYSLAIFISAKHFDYSSCQACLASLAKTSDGRFGHAWVSLRGLCNGQPVEIIGGHSGELGRIKPRYFDGVADLVESGDPNPIRYLWEVQGDGFFQKGSGEHRPTYAAQVAITPEQFDAIFSYIQAYPYNEYCLTGRQCTTFCMEIAALADWYLDGTITLPISSTIYFGGSRMRLWQDPCYASITFASPDRLEHSLKESVKAKQARRI